MIKAVIFDMDGTIIDSMPLWTHVGSDYLNSLGIAPKPGLDDKIFYMNISQFIEYVKQQYSVNDTSEKIYDDINCQIIENYKDVKDKPGAIKLLKCLKKLGIILILATASSRQIAESVLTRLSMWQLFDKHYCDIKKSKPDIFYEIAKSAGLHTYECCVAEDTVLPAENAKAAGMKILGVHDAVTQKYSKSMKEVSDLYYDTLENTDSIINEIIKM